ncbi:CMTR2 [Bugula neritina]|uniref:Cap-specific mRNA (nucleoside-2'-O-)-methyltransferase 2 n=1 Tax=Bugula neritina TaxID=10212 RepID=A0A7J7JAR2_BUGNE|nr:CMTR2 [Bugula neritina]
MKVLNHNLHSTEFYCFIQVAAAMLIRYSLDRWLFGLDNTGDVTKSLNRKHIVQQAKENLGSNIRLVTADGSLDCQLSPSEQEMIVYPLILAEVHIALSLLAKSGVFVLKMFTLFETQTISLLYLLNSLFKHVDIHKPVTSKPGNSEVYVVCKCLLAEVSDNILSLIQSALDTGGPLMSLSEIPRSFLQQVRTAAAKFKDMQEQTITENMSTYGTQVTFISNEKYAREYLSRMRLKPIPADQSVVVMSYPRTKPVKVGDNFLTA